jgi:hypothetical protein
MNPNYFYDLKYISPYGYHLFEYSKLDTEQRVDFSVYYDDSMLDAGFFNDEGRALLDQYRAISAPFSSYPSLALEFDCGSKIPAFFTKLQFRGFRAEETMAGLASILGVNTPPLPLIEYPAHYDEIGIYPERNRSLFKFAVRGHGQALKDFADLHGCNNTDVIMSVDHPPMNTAVNFNWDGERMSHFTFSAPDLGVNDEWVQHVTEHNAAKCAEYFGEREYNIQRVVKMSIGTDLPDGYLKAYFIVRASK